jgi:hypothetical protein
MLFGVMYSRELNPEHSRQQIKSTMNLQLRFPVMVFCHGVL